jgi:hypothetical protein
VRLLPGVFRTAGHAGDSSFSGWAAQSGMRIAGSGMGATTLRLIPANGATRYAVGTNFGATNLAGFELTDLTIDCNLPPSPANGTRTGAVRVRGSHIYLRRVRGIRYGARSADGKAVVPVFTAAGEGSENCVMLDCAVEEPAPAHNSIASIYVFAGDTSGATLQSGHRFCVVRNCAVRGAAGFENPIPQIAERVRAIEPGPGLGTVIDGNQVANCAVGVYDAVGGLTRPARDMVISNNYFRNVSQGLWFRNNGAVELGRLVLLDNFIELATAAGGLSGDEWQTGIRISSTQTGTRFAQLVIRKNIIRDVQVSLGVTSGLKGIHLQRCGESIIENNILDNIADNDAIRLENCLVAKCFNNQDHGGKLLRGYDANSRRQVSELKSQLENALPGA